MDNKVAQAISEILALAIVRQRQKQSHKSLDFSDTGSVYAVKETEHEE